jgi:threonine synthase
MDVGDPSNFVRIRHLFDYDDQQIRSCVSGYSYTDSETRDTIMDTFRNENYLMCPHTAIGYRAAREYQKEKADSGPFVTLATAHPVKFRDVIEPEIGREIEIPERLAKWISEEKKSIEMEGDFDSFKSILLGK